MRAARSVPGLSQLQLMLWLTEPVLQEVNDRVLQVMSAMTHPVIIRTSQHVGLAPACNILQQYNRCQGYAAELGCTHLHIAVHDACQD